MNSATDKDGKDVCISPRQKRIGALFALIFITAPYVFLRLHGDDYSKGSSFTLVDVFLSMAGLMMLLVILRSGKIYCSRLRLVSKPLVLVGVIFTVCSLISGVEGLVFYGVDDGFSLGSLLSGTVQYAFIMIFLPIFASQYLSADNLKQVIRYIGLGYLFPMILTLVFLPHSSPERARQVFYFASRALGAYGNANTFAGIIVMILPYYVYLAITDRGRWRVMGYLSVMLSFICLFLTVCFSGTITLVIVIVVNIVFAVFWTGHPIYKYKARFIQLAAVSIFCTVTVSSIAIANMPSIMEDVSTRLFFLNADNDKAVELDNLGSGAGRMELINIALRLIESRKGALLWGHGMRQTSAIHDFSFAGPHQDIHLIYLLLWVEGGLVLLLLFLAYLLLMFRNVTKLAKIYPFEAMAVGTAGLGLALFGMFYPHMYMRFFWIPLLPAFVNWGAYLHEKPLRSNRIDYMPCENTEGA